MSIWGHYLNAKLSELLRYNSMLDVSRTQDIVLAGILKWCNLSTHYESKNPCANTSRDERCFKMTSRIYSGAGCGSYSLIHVPRLAKFTKLEIKDVLIRVAHWFYILLRVEKFEMTDNVPGCVRYSSMQLFYAISNSTSLSLPTPYKHLKSLCGKLPPTKIMV